MTVKVGGKYINTKDIKDIYQQVVIDGVERFDNKYLVVLRTGVSYIVNDRQYCKIMEAFRGVGSMPDDLPF